MSRLLLDTHVFLWAMTAPERLGPARELVEDDRNEVLLSAASSWELAVKWALGKLPLPERPETYVPDRMQRSGIAGLQVSHAHALRAAGLPHHHRDPFDRMLVAQALVENLTLVTADTAFQPYGTPLVLVD